MINKQTKIYTFIVSTFFVFSSTVVFAAGAFVPLESGALKDLGVTDTSANLAGFLGNIFNYIIALAVVMALVMIIWGGIEYMTTDSWSGKDAGKERIVNALTGLGIALASWLILYTINPDLVTFSGNTFLNPTKQDTTASGLLRANDIINGSVLGSSATTQPCKSVCIMATSVGLSCKDSATCMLNESLANKLKIAMAGYDARITEGYPPTAPHIEACHQDGTCADVNFTDKSTDPTRVTALFNSFKAAGLNPLYESTACQNYPGITCKNTGNTTHFHVRL